MNAEIDQFILHLATERGLSDNYQLSTRASLELFAKWAADKKRAAAWAEVTPEAIGDFLERKEKAKPRPEVMAAYQATLAPLGEVYAHLAK